MSERRLELPILKDAPSPRPRLNPNCVVVSYLGEPMYPSCESCDLNIGSCLQFNGQLHTGIVVVLLLVLLAVPLPLPIGVALVGLAMAVLWAQLRQVGDASQRSIAQEADLREKASRLERRERIHAAASQVRSSPDIKLSERLAGPMFEALGVRRFMVLQGCDEGCSAKADRSRLNSETIAGIGRFLRRLSESPEHGPLSKPFFFADLPDTVLEGGEEVFLRSALATAWIAPIWGRGSTPVGVLIIWVPGSTREARALNIEGGDILAAQVGLLLENDDLVCALGEGQRTAALGEIAFSITQALQRPVDGIAEVYELLADVLPRIRRTMGEEGTRASAREEADALLAKSLDALGDAAQAQDLVRRILRDMDVLAGTGREEEEKELIDPASAARDAVSRFLDRYSDCESAVETLEILTEPSPGVWMNRNDLTQVLDSLLDHAWSTVSASDPDRADIQLRTRPDEDGWIEIRVDHSGPEVPLELRDRVFQPFVIARFTGQGYGLGPAVVERLVRGAGGNVEYQARPGGGHRFVARLPASSKLAPPVVGMTAEGEHVTPERPSTSPRILLVEDDVKLRTILEMFLEGVGEITTAGNGVEGLDALQRDHFDVILCDVMMPEMDGRTFFESCEQRFAEVVDRFVFMSGGATSAENRDFLQQRIHGGTPVLTKPFDPKELEQRIQEVLGVVERVA